MGVRVLVVIPPLFQESFILFSVEVGLLKLHVGEVRPKVFSTRPDPEVFVMLLLLLLLIKSMAVGATDPGVKLGSSSGFFIPGPFHGLPGSNSGMPKVSMPLRASELDPPRPDAELGTPTVEED